MIADYLDGNLPSAEKRYFEGRYLRIPQLQRKVDEVRRQRNVLRPATRPPVWTNWRVAFALASILLLGFGIWIYRSHLTKPAELAARNQPPQANSAISIRISPGSVKGIDSKPAQFEPPANGSTIHLILELPGQLSPAQCQVKISMVGPDGRWVPVWSSPEPLRSSFDGTGQALTIKLVGAALQPGDYVVEAWTPNGEVRETYVYRVKKN